MVGDARPRVGRARRRRRRRAGAPTGPRGCRARARSRSSVTSSAAPWFTNGLAVSDFGYGNETIRLSGPTVAQLAPRSRACARPRVRVVGRDQRELRPHARRLGLAVRQRRALRGRAARARRAGSSRARGRCPPGTPGASLRTRAGCASRPVAAAPRSRRPPAAPAPFASAPAIRVTPVSPAAIRVATASSARSGLSPPVGRVRSRSTRHRQARAPRRPRRGRRRRATTRPASSRSR